MTNRASRNAISARLPGAPAIVSSAFSRRPPPAPSDRVERNKAMALAQAREIDAILVTELSRWGRSTQDLVQTLDPAALALDGAMHGTEKKGTQHEQMPIR
jgi:hypothetical protein